MSYNEDPGHFLSFRNSEQKQVEPSHIALYTPARLFKTNYNYPPPQNNAPASARLAETIYSYPLPRINTPAEGTNPWKGSISEPRIPSHERNETKHGQQDTQTEAKQHTAQGQCSQEEYRPKKQLLDEKKCLQIASNSIMAQMSNITNILLKQEENTSDQADGVSRP